MTSRVWCVLLGISVACSRADPPRDDRGVPGSTRADSGSTQRVDSARAWAVPPSAHNVTCEPATIAAGDTLTIRMTRPHGKSFHVLAPDGTPYIVVFHGEGQADRGQRRSLVPPDSFAKLTEITLDTKTARAGVWVFGRDTNEALFRAPGTYRLIVGDDLETDGPVYAECLVTFRP